MYQAFEKAVDNSSFSSKNLEKKCYIFTSLLTLKVCLVPNHLFKPELSYEKLLLEICKPVFYHIVKNAHFYLCLAFQIFSERFSCKIVKNGLLSLLKIYCYNIFAKYIACSYCENVVNK